MPSLGPKFMNMTAWTRRSGLRFGQLVPSNADLSQIAAPEDFRFADLSAQIDGAATSFTLPYEVRHVEELQWNNTPVLMGAQTPMGFRVANDRVTITTNFTAQIGDTLVAKVLA